MLLDAEYSTKSSLSGLYVIALGLLVDSAHLHRRNARQISPALLILVLIAAKCIKVLGIYASYDVLNSDQLDIIPYTFFVYATISIFFTSVQKPWKYTMPKNFVRALNQFPRGANGIDIDLFQVATSSFLLIHFKCQLYHVDTRLDALRTHMVRDCMMRTHT